MFKQVYTNYKLYSKKCQGKYLINILTNLFKHVTIQSTNNLFKQDEIIKGGENMGKYLSQSKELLKLVGGKENISAVTHCVTRMRFVLRDPSKADTDGIEKINGVKGTFTQAGQFQVIIGQDVAEFYNDFTEVSGIEGVSKDDVKAAAKKNQNFVQRIMSTLAEIFAPLIPALVIGGLILGFRNIIDSVEFFDGGKTIVDLYPFWAGVDKFLWLIGEAIFHMLPVGICWSITKKMGTTQILGIILGLTLVSGQLLNAYSVASTAAADIPKWDFGFAQVDMIGYQAQVIPAMLAGFCLVYLEKFFTKISPKVISMIVVPFFSLLLAVMASHFILGPIGWKVGAWISNVVHAGLVSSFNWIFAAIFGFFYAPLVITGLHHMTNAIDTQLASDFGGTILWPMIALSNIAQGSAVLGMIFLQRKNIKSKEISIPACISCYLGVTEPAIFGVNLKYGFPFICGMIGSAIAAVISVGSGVMANSIGVGGIPGILSIQPQYMITFAICMAVSIVVPFVLTYIVGKKKLSKVDLYGEDNENQDITENEGEITAPLTGKVIPITEVSDEVFSQKILGDGIAIESENQVLVSPCDGVVSNVADGSFHACGLTLKNGMELLFHIGLDTVNMQGDGFNCFVKEGDTVVKGQKLIEFDLEKIKKAGHPTETMMVVCNEGSASKVEFISGIYAKACETAVIKFS